MTDDPRLTAFNPDAPEPERQDALTNLSRGILPSSNDVAGMRTAIDFFREELEVPVRKNAIQVMPVPGDGRRGKRGMQSVYLDGLQLQVSGDYFERSGPLDMHSLRSMVEQTPILNAVILTRIRQISRFTQPSEDGGPGFEVRHKDREHQATEPDKDFCRKMLGFFQNCGWEFNPRRRLLMRRDNFPGFMAKLVRDSLTMDSSPIETEFKRDHGLGIDGLYAVDGATIRLCTEEGYQGDDRIFALQVIEGRICTAYSHDDLIYQVRNPRTDVRLAGYGLGETELLIRIVTGFLNALTTNIKGFSDNAIPRGLLHLSGDYNQEDLSAFKRYWNAMVKGVNNTWSLPVMVSKDQESRASFEKFGIEFNEMYFAKWMTFLTSIICAVYTISPDEINFEAFSARSSALSGNDTAEKLADGKDKGLRPLLAYFEAVLTDFVVSAFDDTFVFRFAGLDPDDAAQRWDAQKLVLTVDEVRAERGYKPMAGPLGAAPLNPALIQPWLTIQQSTGQQSARQQAGKADPAPADPTSGFSGSPANAAEPSPGVAKSLAATVYVI